MNQSWRRRLGASLVVALTVVGTAGCPRTPEPLDDAGRVRDAGRDSGMRTDGGMGNDAGMDSDAGMVVDGGSVDGGSVDGGMGMDAGMGADSGMRDAGMPDAGMMMPMTAAQIAAVRAATPGSHTPALPVDGAVVTYVRPALGGDPAGFFVQAGRMGGALFVAIEASTLTPVPAVGNTLSFDVDTTALVTGQLRVTAISALARMGTGADVAAMVQDVSGVDLPAMLDAYDSELVTLTATLASATSACGSPHQCTQITTTGVPTAGGALRLRAVDTVMTAAAAAQGCVVRIGPTPLWRFNADAQPSAWMASELTRVSCPAPAVGNMVINEIGLAFTGADTGLEFVELVNASSGTVDLAGCTLRDTGGATATVSGSTIVGPGEFFVIAGASSEITANLALPTALTLGDTDTLTFACGGTTIDVLNWTVSGFPALTDEVSWQLSPAATDATMNDMGSNWCLTPTGTTYGAMGRRGSPGMANPMCGPACVPATHLVISEVDYDQAGSDNAEFVEIHNPTAGAISLDGLAVILVNGSGDVEYGRATLTGSLAAGGYLVVGIAGQTLTLPGGVTRVDFTGTSSIQNGPDGVALVNLTSSTAIDAMSYGSGASIGTVSLTGGGSVTLTESLVTAGTDTTTTSLARIPTGCDTDMPASDWMRAPPTPGAANTL